MKYARQANWRTVVIVTVGLAAAVTILVKTVTLFDQNRRVAAAIRSVQSATPAKSNFSQLLDASLYYDIEFAELADDSGPAVLIVVRDDCDYCLEALAVWRAAATSVPIEVPIVVVRPANSKAPPQSVLPVGTRLLRIRDLDEFSLRTGVIMVPTAVALDTQSKIVAAVRGVPSVEIAQRALRVAYEPSAGGILMGRSDRVADLSAGSLSPLTTGVR